MMGTKESSLLKMVLALLLINKCHVYMYEYNLKIDLSPNTSCKSKQFNIYGHLNMLN